MAEGEPPAYAGDEKPAAEDKGDSGGGPSMATHGGDGPLITEVPLGDHTLEIRVNFFAWGTCAFLLFALIFGAVAIGRNQWGWMEEGRFFAIEGADSDEWNLVVSSASLDRRFETRLYTDCDSSGCTEKDLEDDDRDNFDEKDCKDIRDLDCDDCDDQADWCFQTLSAMDAAKFFYIAGIIVTVFAMIVLVITTALPESLGLPEALRLVGRVCVILPAVVFVSGFFLFIFIWPYARVDKAREDTEDSIDDDLLEPDSRAYAAGGGGMIIGIITWFCACGACCLGSAGYQLDKM
jgi:hypothetical protein